MKKLLFLALLLVLGYVLFVGGPLLADGAELTRVVFNTERAPNGYVTVPFVSDSERYTFVNVAVDLNKDGSFAVYESDAGPQEEWIVRNMGVRILKDEANNFSVLLPDTGIEERGELTMRVVLSKDELNNWDGNLEAGGKSREYTIAQVGAEDYGPFYSPDPTGERSGGFPLDVLGGTALAADAPDVPPTSGPGNPLSGGPEGEAVDTTGQGSASGRSGAPASFNEFHPGVPDINQGTNECVPTATANSLLWLASEYNFEDKMPEGGSAAVIAELKNDLNWTANGVDVQQDYLDGKRAFTSRNNIPIETHQIGGRFDTSIVSKIAQELRKGQDVEIDMEYGRYSDDGSYRRVGGHMVTVVGSWTAGNNQYLDIHDPLSQGSGILDIYRIDGTRVENYRYQGTAVTYIRYAIAESPIEQETPTDEPTSEPTPETSDEPTPEPTTEATEEPTQAPGTETHADVRDFLNNLEMSFAHVAPGEYSEVYVSVQNVPRGTAVTTSLSGPAVDSPATQTVNADDNGVAYFVFRIFNFGTYTANVSAEGAQNSSATVVVK